MAVKTVKPIPEDWKQTFALRKTGAYVKMRNAFMRKNPLCAICKERGLIVAAAEMDHIEPVKQAPERFWDETNFQALCKKCHHQKTADEKRSGEIRGRAAWMERIA